MPCCCWVLAVSIACEHVCLGDFEAQSLAERHFALQALKLGLVAPLIAPLHEIERMVDQFGARRSRRPACPRASPSRPK